VDINELRRNVINLATSLAQQESQEKGVDFTTAIPGAIYEACERLDVDRRTFIRLFSWSKTK